jgi:PAS domain S-box-containing protein
VFRNHPLPSGALGVSIVDAWLTEGHRLEDDDTLDGFAWEQGGFSRWMTEMSAGRPIHGVVGTFPARERKILEDGLLSIRSLVAIPIFVDETWWGYISFDHVDEDRRWSDADVEALSLTASTIGAAIERERAVGRLDEAQALYRTLIEQLPAVTYIEELGSGDETYSSPQTQSLLGYTADEWGPHETWVEAIHPEDRERVVAEDEKLGETGEPYRSEYRMLTKRGDVVWVRDEAVLVRDADGTPRYWQGVRFDITTEKEAERQLRQAEERYRQLVEEMPAITYLDEHEPGSSLWPTRYISPQVETIFGFTPEEWLEDPWRWREMVHPDDRESALAADDAHYERGEPLDIELRFFDRAGRLHWLRDQAVIIRDDDGRPRFSQGIIQDVTERKQAELAMLDAERRYRTLIESIPAVTYIDTLDEPWSTVYVSPQVLGTFGFDAETWRQQGLWFGRVHAEDTEAAREAMRAHAEELVPFDLEYRFQHADGRWLWVRDQAFIVRDEDGTPLFSQGVMYDITAAKESEERLRDAEQRYRAIVEHVPAAIYLDRPDGGMETIYMSPQIADIAGVTPEEWVADPGLWLRLIDADDRPAIEGSYTRAVLEQEPWRAEYRIHTPDGRTVWIHDETTLLFGPDGAPLFLQGVLFDITERKLAEQALRESERRERDAAERLRALDDMKNTFLAAVSHELRSPLTSILGLSLTLERAPDIDGADKTDLLTRLSANAKKLDRLLKDLLDIDRLNRGIVEPQYRVTDVAALARRTVEHLDALAEREVIVHTDPVVIPIDPPKIERIVENLLTNAVRHTTPDRKIWLTVAPHDGGVRISVEDDGPGVPVDIRDAIFEPFRQGPTQSPHSPGTGIGLSLVARFAELHGGTAWVDERDGGGAAFHVVIPGRVPEHVDASVDRQRADAG